MEQRTKTAVIIDTDPGVDDAITILLALASPEIEILAYVVSYGNTDVEASYTNILKIYEAVSRHLERYPDERKRFPNLTTDRKPLIIRGADGPLEGPLHSAHYFHGRDGLGDITNRHPDLTVQISDIHPCLQSTTGTAVDAVLDLIRIRPSRSIAYVALGPLTNLAQLLRADRSTVRDRLGRIYCMGGALDVPGNTSPVAEFNFFADPYAVKELLVTTNPDEGIPLERFLLLPLDITTPHELSFSKYKEKVDPEFDSAKRPSTAGRKSPITHFTSSFLERTREVMLEFGKDAMELHDIVALWCAIQNPPVAEEAESAMPTLTSGWSATKRVFDIERTGELTRGMLVVDRREDESAYAPGENRAHVQAVLDKLKIGHGTFESSAVPAEVEVEEKPELVSVGKGVPCVTKTPGSETLVDLLLYRVWNVI